MPNSADDPDAFARIDRDIRLNEAWHEADEIAREKAREEGLWGEEAEEAVEHMRGLYAFDTATDTSQHEIFRAEGIELPDPEDMDDATLTAKLWEVIHALAARNTFLHSTDHLNDRELYTYLVDECFHEITKDIPQGTGWVHGIDLVSSGSEEDIELYLRYYADESDREHWAKSFPEDPVPPKEKPPFDRDRLLPKARYE